MKTQFAPLTVRFLKTALIEAGASLSVITLLEDIYNEEQRHFHTCNHINLMFEELSDFIKRNPDELNAYEITVLSLAIGFHDSVYIPWRNDNEENSAELMNRHLDCLEATRLIIGSKEHEDTDKLSKIFNYFDTKGLRENSLGELIKVENQIFKEYNFAKMEDYINHRCMFLAKFNIGLKKHNDDIPKLIEYIKNRQYNIAIYPGSFNPFTMGHLDVTKNAEAMFDKVILVQGVNASKDNPAFGNLKSLETLKSRECIQYDGNIINDIIAKGPLSIYNPVLIRGIRNATDLAYEENYIAFCKEIHPELRHCFIQCDKKYSHISSSALRDLYTVSPELYNKYIVR
jgi:pantetheine-phosphate adenylyltransferase